MREYADATFGRAYKPGHAMFQYWHGLTNKQLVGYLRQYHETTSPKPTLEDIMRRAAEYTACYNPGELLEGYSCRDPKPERRRDGDGSGSAGTGSSYLAKRAGESAKRGVSKKEGKSPANGSRATKSGGKGASQSQGPGAMTAEQVREAAERQGVTAGQ